MAGRRPSSRSVLLKSAAMDLMISVAGVLIFTGLVAYDTQKIGRMASQPGLAQDSDAMMRVSILGALRLYLDFINLFIFLLRLMGRRR